MPGNLESKHSAELFEMAKDPKAWFDEARRLQQDSKVLSERAEELLEELSKVDETAEGDLKKAERLGSLMRTSLFLSGLSLENALKGYLIRERPQESKIQVTVDGNGMLMEAELKKIAGSRPGHDLKYLAEKGI